MTDPRKSNDVDPNLDTPFLRAALARLDALPPGFTDWYRDLEPWPEDVPEVMGGDADGPFKAPYRLATYEEWLAAMAEDAKVPPSK